MKKLIKGLLIFIITIVLIIGIPLGILYFMVADSKDNAPTSLYQDSVVLDREIADLINHALSDNENYDFTLSEDDINILIFALIRDSLNKDYYNSGCDDEECKNIKVITLVEGIPVIGGKKAYFKHLYAEISGKEMTFYATLDILGMIKTRLKLGFEVGEKDGVYTVKVHKMGLGKINLAKGLGKKIRDPIFSSLGITENEINSKLEKKNLPITFSADDFAFTFDRKDLGAIIAGLLLPDEDKPENTIIKELFALLTTPDEGGLSFGFYDDPEERFGMRLDMKPFAGDEETYDASLNAIKVPFDVDAFIKNKTQTFLLANLTGGDMKVVFTADEFNRLLYDKTNGYENFKYEIPFAEGEANFSLAVKGIAVEIPSSDQIKFNFLVDINGLKSIMVLSGGIEPNETEDEITIYLNETVTIGEVETSAAFLFDIIGDNVESFELMEYRPQDRAFLITVQAFNSFMSVGGESTPLEAERIRFGTNVLEVFVKVDDPSLQETIENVTGMINDLLSGDFLDPDAFTGQEEEIEELNAILDDINDILNNPEEELDEEDVDQLIEIINQLDEENQQELYNQIEDALLDNEDLLELYDLLFGN